MINLTETQKEKLNEVWESIQPDSIEYLDRNFNNIAPQLLVFLILSLISNETIEIGIFIGDGVKGSCVSFDVYNSDKQLTLKLQEDDDFEIELLLYDFDQEEKKYSYTLSKSDIESIPPGLSNIMKNVRDEGESKCVIKNSLTK
ncbi:MAG TPA: hypothetical protein VFW07_19405 [Parafilimonas sp.]|nr:hypothetical protein [Parafilimonas sp.]